MAEVRCDARDEPTHAHPYILIPLFALLAAAIWFAGTTWIHLGGAMCRQDEGDDDPRD